MPFPRLFNSTPSSTYPSPGSLSFLKAPEKANLTCRTEPALLTGESMLGGPTQPPGVTFFHDSLDPSPLNSAAFFQSVSLSFRLQGSEDSGRNARLLGFPGS